MLLPKNGKAIIIDDRPEQALPLILSLSKHNIPCTYYDARKETIPSDKHTDVRVLFLDINLNDGPADWETEKSLLRHYVEGIIAPKLPYILFIWSVNEKDNTDNVLDLFRNELKDYAPLIAPILLRKYELFDLDPETNQYHAAPGVDLIKEIDRRIEEQLEGFDSIEALIKWENIVQYSSSEVVKEIFSLAATGQDINESIKNIYFKLAEAMWGKQLKLGNDQEIALKATSIFNQLLTDRIDFHVNQNLEYSLIKNITPPVNFQDKDKATFNSKLLITIDSNKKVLPGNVYEYNEAEAVENFPFKGMIADTLNVPVVSEEFYTAIVGERSKEPAEVFKVKNEKKKQYQTFEKEIREKIKNASKFIGIETSPICDYVQKKWKSNRLCPGILWHSSFMHYIGKADSLYVSPILNFNGDTFFMVIDLRYFTSFPPEVLEPRIPAFRLKHSFLVDIQSHLSRHINRPGISFLN